MLGHIDVALVTLLVLTMLMSHWKYEVRGMAGILSSFTCLQMLSKTELLLVEELMYVCIPSSPCLLPARE